MNKPPPLFLFAISLWLLAIGYWLLAMTSAAAEQDIGEVLRPALVASEMLDSKLAETEAAADSVPDLVAADARVAHLRRLVDGRINVG